MGRLTDKNHNAINKCSEYSSCYSCHKEKCYIKEIEEKLGELEDVLEKYGIETTEELDGVLKPLIDNGELENWKSATFWKMQTERLKKELAELKQKAIVPKFKIGDKVYGIIDTWAYTDVRPVEIRGTHLLYEVWDGEDTTKQHFTRIFATKEEAEQKLAEIGGKDE